MAHTYPQGNPTPYPGQPEPSYEPPPVVQQPVTVEYPAKSAVVPQMVSNQIGSNPCYYVCKSCHHNVVTKVKMKATTRTHLFALLLCLLGCWPCVCVPYCMHSCNNADHYCPNCGAYIGSCCE